MGIKGLLPFLSQIHEKIHISEFAGQVVGVDGYCWIHRGIIGCALDLAHGKPTNFYIKYFIKRINILIANGVIPLVIFDGASYNAKSETENERREKRNKCKELGDECYRKGDMKQAIQFYQGSIDVTPKMAAEIISECKELDISCIVAPYEADAQIAKLYQLGIINACISEDSDLLVFGCKIVIYKLEPNGHGVKINCDNISKISSVKSILDNQISFMELCVFSGCDYLSSIKGIGLTTACKLFQQYNDIFKVIRNLRIQKGISAVPVSYENNFRDALFFFRHHWVFDPISVRIVTLSGEDAENLKLDDSPYICQISDSTGFQIALGNINPHDNSILGFNHYNDFKILYEKSNSNRLEMMYNLSTNNKKNIRKNINLTETPLFSPTIKPLHSSSVPNIRGTKSEYFSSKITYNDDESILSPIVVDKKRRWASQQNDEDIDSFARKLSFEKTISLPVDSKNIISLSQNNMKKSIKLGLSKRHKSFEKVKKENTLLNYVVKR